MFGPLGRGKNHLPGGVSKGRCSWRFLSTFLGFQKAANGRGLSKAKKKTPEKARKRLLLRASNAVKVFLVVFGGFWARCYVKVQKISTLGLNDSSLRRTHETHHLQTQV